MNTTSPDLTLAEPIGNYLITRDGAQLRLRPAADMDGKILADFFAKLSPEDVRYRFLDARKWPNEDQITAMLEVDHRRIEHLLAFDTGTGELIASLMMVADAQMETAELAIAVSSAWKGRGIGWTLLRHARELAFMRGVKTLRCIEDRSHCEAIEVEHALGFHQRDIEGEPTLVLLEAEVG